MCAGKKQTKKKKKTVGRFCAQQHFNLKVLVNLQGHVLSPPTIITITDSSSRLDGSAAALTGGVVVEVTLARPRLAACHPAPLPIPVSKRSASSTRLVTRIHRWPFSRIDLSLLRMYAMYITDNHPSIHPGSFCIRWGTSCNYDFIAEPRKGTNQSQAKMNTCSQFSSPNVQVFEHHTPHRKKASWESNWQTSCCQGNSINH